MPFKQAMMMKQAAEKARKEIAELEKLNRLLCKKYDALEEENGVLKKALAQEKARVVALERKVEQLDVEKEREVEIAAAKVADDGQ